MRNKARRALFAVVFACALLLSSGHALAAGGGQTIFVAGNPELYPIEYYDPSAEQYCGLMPQLYEILSERTGYTFTYIEAGRANGQERMAKNDQAEVISAYWDGEIDPQYLRSPQLILTMDRGNGTERVNLAFSEIASEQLIAEVAEALSGISADQRLALLASHAMQVTPNHHYVTWIWILSAAVVLFLAAIVVTLVWIGKKHRSDQKNNMIDERYGIGNDRYYVHCFDELISDKSKSLYYLAYIAFDEADFVQRYGGGESKNIHRYAAEFLNRKISAVDYLALVSEGVFALLYQDSARTAAEEHIRTLMEELGDYLGDFRMEYAGLFHAGVCMLEENPGYTSEAALYNAKQGYLHAVERGAGYAFSTKGIIEENRQKERLNQQVVKAIQNGEFQIYLQYIVDRNGRIFGAEAVSRWHHPQEGVLYPSKYIQMINQSDTMTMHDFYIFEQVCRQLEEWGKAGRGELCISCNFTRYSITNTDFTDRLKEILDRYEFRRNHLFIELTEDSLSCDMAALKRNVETCKTFGIRIALDDIGSGYSSLSDLSNFPFDLVKVERDIVIHADTQRGGMLLQGLIQLSHSMKLQVLCEGVETAEQNKTVLDAGCDLIQGFYYSRVLPRKEAKRFLESYRAK